MLWMEDMELSTYGMYDLVHAQTTPSTSHENIHVLGVVVWPHIKLLLYRPIGGAARIARVRTW